MKGYLLLAALLMVLSVSGSGQEAKNENPACASYPCVVASISLPNQSVPVSQAPIYTPATSGLFRVTYYMEADTRGIGSNWTLSWSWRDDLKTETPSRLYLEPGQYFNVGSAAVQVDIGGASSQSYSDSNQQSQQFDSTQSLYLVVIIYIDQIEGGAWYGTPTVQMNALRLSIAY
jgi:hypothetical protein